MSFDPAPCSHSTNNSTFPFFMDCPGSAYWGESLNSTIAVIHSPGRIVSSLPGENREPNRGCPRFSSPLPCLNLTLNLPSSQRMLFGFWSCSIIWGAVLHGIVIGYFPLFRSLISPCISLPRTGFSLLSLTISRTISRGPRSEGKTKPSPSMPGNNFSQPLGNAVFLCFQADSAGSLG